MTASWSCPSLERAARRAVEWNVEQGLVTDAPVIDDRIIAAFRARMRDFAIRGDDGGRSLGIGMAGEEGLERSIH